MNIVVVGVCASGKSTLVKALNEIGFSAYHITQEHSCIPRLWRKRNPDLVIFLSASLATIRQRRKIAWGDETFRTQQIRLGDAKQYADLVIETDPLSPAEVLTHVLSFLNKHNRNGGEKFEVE
ncbi:hypothetical protein [Azotosporobacter soli]|uniref:hypothetical protein n=1 Tax=Azotosporobacter soli TaxID=3055040 RepID=UPI0031FEDEBC